MRLAALLALLLLLSTAYSFNCSGSVTSHAPAVVGNGGGLVLVTLKFVPGDGDIYLGVEPRSSYSIQGSVETAVGYAFQLAGKNNSCDTLVSFDGEDAGDYVEGPSAGGLITVMAYSVVTGKPLRTDTVFTGSIDTTGKIGVVGGLYEKAGTAAKKGKKYFLIPETTLFEKLLLENIENSTGITIYEVKTIKEATDFMVHNLSLSKKPFEAEPRKVPQLPKYDTTGIEKFASVAQYMVQLENASVRKLQPASNRTAAIKRYFEAEIAIQEKLIGLGYLYPAANFAFLDYIEAETLDSMVGNDVDLAREASSIESCLNNLPTVQKTDSNLEWVAGADLRKGWALRQLNETDTYLPYLADEKYVALNELLFADAWCHVSRSLASAGGKSGTPINESSLKKLADKYMADAEALKIKSSDSQTHLRSAKILYDKGLYAAAIMDCTYVLEMERATNEVNNYDTEDINYYTGVMLAENRTSLWGKIYQTQGAYLARQETGNSTAYKILSYARGLDSSFSQIRAAAVPGARSMESPLIANPSLFPVLVLIFIMITVLLFFIVEILSKKPSSGRSHGKKS